MLNVPPKLVVLSSVVALIATFGTPSTGRTQVSSLIDVENVGLPGIDRGVVSGDSRAPDSLETLRRRAIRTRVLPSRAGSSGRLSVNGRLIVKFRDGTPRTARAAALRAVSPTATLSEQPAYADFDLVRIDRVEDVEAAARSFRARPDVEYAQPAYRVHTMFVPNDPLYGRLQWNFPLIDVERAWDIQPQAGSSVTVAVVDTGVAYQNATLTVTAGEFVGTDDDGVEREYPALGRITIPYAAATQLGTGRFVAPYNFIWNTNTPLDLDGHGTHVSGTLGQSTNDGIGTAGIAFNVKLMPVKVIATEWDVIFGLAPDVGGSDDQVARGIRYAADNGAKIINMSIGSEGPSGCGSNPTQSGCSPAIEAAMRYAVGKGSFIAVAGGNAFTDGNPTEVIAEIASRIEGAVSVAAVDPQKRRAGYSSTGAFIELAAPGGVGGLGEGGYVWQQTFDFNFTDTFLQKPSEYSAPRFDLLAYIGYAGTSMAVPHVSGVAAMLMQQGITDPAAIEAALEKFATDIGTPGRDNEFGFGLIEARNTLRGLGLAR